MKGYKVFNKDWTCRGFQYEVGKTYEMKEDPVCCERGFHFCGKLIDCFGYYDFNSENKVAEIEALGTIDDNGNKEKYCTNKIKIVRELSWHEVLDLVNTGKDNTGRGNAGNRNAGNENTGNWNIGNRNAGNWNAGNWNAGNRNAGNWNAGNGNTGNENTGNWNTGDWNSTDFSTGCFNTKEEKIRLFNKRSKWTYRDWRCSSARDLMCDCPHTKTVWINEKYMTDSEKEENSTWKRTGGYLKTIEVTNEDKQKWWDNLDDEEQEEIKSLPNFDKEIFKEITGIEV
nr:MAG TPA: hypothetical protein [Caudoviricetes sp.]